MEEAFTFALAAPFIVLAVALIRYVVPELRGRFVPPIVLVFTVLWGLVLVYDGRFTGGLAEFIVTTVMVAAAALGVSGFVSVSAPKGSTVERVT